MASQFFDSDAESDREEAGTSSERYSEENLKAKHDFQNYVANLAKVHESDTKMDEKMFQEAIRAKGESVS